VSDGQSVKHCILKDFSFGAHAVVDLQLVYKALEGLYLIRALRLPPYA